MISFEDVINTIVFLAMAYYFVYTFIDHNVMYIFGLVMALLTLVSCPILLADVWIRNIERSKNIAYE